MLAQMLISGDPILFVHIKLHTDILFYYWYFFFRAFYIWLWGVWRTCASGNCNGSCDRHGEFDWQLLQKDVYRLVLASPALVTVHLVPSCEKSKFDPQNILIPIRKMLEEVPMILESLLCTGWESSGTFVHGIHWH